MIHQSLALNEIEFLMLGCQAAEKLHDKDLLIKRMMQLRASQSSPDKIDDVEKFGFHKFPKLKTPEEFASTTKYNLFGIWEKERIKTFYTHTSHSIHDCLTKGLSKDESKLATTCFKELISYGGDKSSNYPHTHMIPFVKTMISNIKLWDELFC